MRIIKRCIVALGLIDCNGDYHLLLQERLPKLKYIRCFCRLFYTRSRSLNRRQIWNCRRLKPTFCYASKYEDGNCVYRYFQSPKRSIELRYICQFSRKASTSWFLYSLFIASFQRGRSTIMIILLSKTQFDHDSYIVECFSNTLPPNDGLYKHDIAYYCRPCRKGEALRSCTSTTQHASAPRHFRLFACQRLGLPWHRIPLLRC